MEDARSDNHGMVSLKNVHQESGQKVTISHDWMVEQSLRKQQSEGKQFTNIFTEIVTDKAEKTNCISHDIKHKKRATINEPYCFPITLRSQCKKEIDTCMSNSDIINIFNSSLAADLVCVQKKKKTIKWQMIYKDWLTVRYFYDKYINHLAHIFIRWLVGGM